MWAARFLLVSTLLGAAAGCDCGRMLAVKRREGAPTSGPGIDEPVQAPRFAEIPATPPPTPRPPPPPVAVTPTPPPVVATPPPRPIEPAEPRYAAASEPIEPTDVVEQMDPVEPPPGEKIAQRPIGRLEPKRLAPAELMKGGKMMPAFRKLRPLRLAPANGTQDHQ